MRRGLNIIFSLVLLAFAPVQAAEIEPHNLVESTAQEVLAIIKQDKDIQAGNKAKILGLVEAKILPHFNFSRMTKLAMGKNWPKATPEQKEGMIKEFRTLLVRTYSNALSTYRDQVIKVEPTKIQPADVDVVVKTQVMLKQGQQAVTIDYSMEKITDDWKVYDVTVAGISLVTNYRSSFDSQVRANGVEGLLKTLIEKNRSMEDKDKNADS